jgi:hypothetical protein
VIQNGQVTYGVIHFSDRFPVVRTACGGEGPATNLWMYTDCVACLRRAPNDPRIKKRLEDVLAASSRDHRCE